MKVFISNKEIEEIASGLIQVACGRQESGQIDIDSVARFLGLPVLYEQIMEDDMDKIGYLSNGSYPLYVKRNQQQGALPKLQANYEETGQSQSSIPRPSPYLRCQQSPCRGRY